MGENNRELVEFQMPETPSTELMGVMQLKGLEKIKKMLDARIKAIKMSLGSSINEVTADEVRTVGKMIVFRKGTIIKKVTLVTGRVDWKGVMVLIKEECVPSTKRDRVDELVDAYRGAATERLSFDIVQEEEDFEFAEEF